MSLYEFLKWIHVLVAALWLGGAMMVQILAIQFRAANSPPAFAMLGEKAGKLGDRYFMPLAIAQLLSGIWLVIEGDLGFEQTWIVIGIAGIVLSSIIGATQLGPTGKKLGELAPQKGLDDPEVTRLLDKVTMLSWVDIGILVVVVWAMVVKPGL